jgi:hypothetical protein
VLPNIFQPYKSTRNNLIRLGPKSDGGYVIDKRVIKKSKTIVTCGLNDDWDFEKSYLKKNSKCKIIAYDHTVNRDFWIKRFKKDFFLLIFFKKLTLKRILDVFKYVDYRLFFNKKNIHYSKKVVLKSNNKYEISIKNILKNQKNIILKIDIEGDEYSILNDINKNFNRINLLIIEFHNVPNNLKKISNFLIKSNLKIIHLHANNYAGLNKNKVPNAIEFTLINSKKFNVNKTKSNKKYPIADLDFRNLKRRDDIKLEFND